MSNKLDESRPAEGGRLGSIPSGGHLGGVGYADLAGLASRAARTEAGLIGDDLDESKGTAAFKYPPIPGSVWVEGGGGGNIDVDFCYVGKFKVTIPAKTTNFLQIDMSTTPATASWVAALPETQDEDKVVFDVTKNRIYIHGAFAGTGD